MSGCTWCHKGYMLPALRPVQARLVQCGAGGPAQASRLDSAGGPGQASRLDGLLVWAGGVMWWATSPHVGGEESCGGPPHLMWVVKSHVVGHLTSCGW